MYVNGSSQVITVPGQLLGYGHYPHLIEQKLGAGISRWATYPVRLVDYRVYLVSCERPFSDIAAL